MKIIVIFYLIVLPITGSWSIPCIKLFSDVGIYILVVHVLVFILGISWDLFFLVTWDYKLVQNHYHCKKLIDSGFNKLSISLTFHYFLSRAGYILFLIERAKKCLDFSATLYIIHLFVCIMYGGWPSSLTWWIVNLTGLVLMALLGEWLCIRRELREIPITRLRSSKFYMQLAIHVKFYEHASYFPILAHMEWSYWYNALFYESWDIYNW